MKRYKTAYERQRKEDEEKKPCPTLSAQCITIQNVTTTAEFDLIRISQHSKGRKKAKEKWSLDIQRKNWVKNKNKNSVKYRSWSGSHFQPVGLLLNFNTSKLLFKSECRGERTNVLTVSTKCSKAIAVTVFMWVCDSKQKNTSSTSQLHLPCLWSAHGVFSYVTPLQNGSLILLDIGGNISK